MTGDHVAATATQRLGFSARGNEAHRAVEAAIHLAQQCFSTQNGEKMGGFMMVFWWFYDGFMMVYDGFMMVNKSEDEDDGECDESSA